MKKTLKTLTDRSFKIDKHLKTGLNNHFLVDNENKRFAVIVGKKGQPKIYNFADLGEYELNEDGNSIMKGKGVATAIGGLTFGLLGALVGGAGKRKSHNTCTSLLVRLGVNDLDNPEIVIPYLKIETKNSSFLYTHNLEAAKELIATLNYISNQGSK